MSALLRQPVTCFGCGRKNTGVHSVGCARQEMRACGRCLKKHGRDLLRKEGDRLLSEYFANLKEQPSSPESGRRVGLCFHCLNEVLPQANGRYPLWCADCERERMSFVNSSNAEKSDS